MPERVYGPMSKEEYEEQRALIKSFNERLRQLRMYDGDFEDEEPDIFIGDGLWYYNLLGFVGLYLTTHMDLDYSHPC